MNTRALVAEFVGTFALIFIGAGAVAVGVGGVVGAAFAHGLTLMAIAFAYGHISGAHINPAVTIGLWVGRQIEAATAIAYILVQLLGGIAGAFLLRFVLGGTGSGLGATVLASGVSPLQGFILELILTFLLVNTVYNTAVSGKVGHIAPLAIGMTLTLSILMGGPLTGASLNPARTLGPAVASGQFAHLWVYLIGTPLGGVLAALLYRNLLKS
jgi:aquaporin Z